MTEQEVRTLLRKYNNGQSSQEERTLLENWYFTEGKNYQFSDANVNLKDLRDEIWEGVLQKSKIADKKANRKTLWIQMAAAIVIMISIGSYFYIGSKSSTFSVKELSGNLVDITPGSNKATLTLADGRVVNLNSDKEGVVIDINSLSYEDGTEVFSTNKADPKTLEVVGINTISTPKGGQYRIILPDGSRVWLNAASTLKYPTNFNNNQRRVELSGEAYFEVERTKASDNNQFKPFIVQSANQEVVVLGTHFNINTYEDEPLAITTLLEGSVDVLSANHSKPNRLVPGQQSIVQQGQKVKIIQADIDENIAWKNGEFVFYNESIESVMREIARWYDIDVIYKDAVGKKRMWGSVSKFKTISEVLRMIELTGTVRFEVNIQGNERRVYVMK